MPRRIFDYFAEEVTGDHLAWKRTWGRFNAGTEAKPNWIKANKQGVDYVGKKVKGKKFPMNRVVDKTTCTTDGKDYAITKVERRA